MPLYNVYKQTRPLVKKQTILCSYSLFLPLCLILRMKTILLRMDEGVSQPEESSNSRYFCVSEQQQDKT